MFKFFLDKKKEKYYTLFFFKIMNHILLHPESERPHIMGLTASLLNSSVKQEAQVKAEIKLLEATLLSKVVTARNKDMVKT